MTIKRGRIGAALLWWLLPLALLAGTLFLYAGRLYESGAFLTWEIRSGGYTARVRTWKGDDGSFYLFLPSQARLEDVVPSVNPLFRVRLNGISLDALPDLRDFDTDTVYPLKVRCIVPVLSPSITILHSANTAALFLDTPPGGLEQILREKGKKTAVQSVLLDPEGGLSYSGEEDTLNGRGQGSWNYPKKSLSLTLKNAAPLLGMPSGTKWALIANYLDPTNLRNKLVYDLAAETGLVLSPRCEYADLWINGVYYGLYLLAQKPESVAQIEESTSLFDNWGGWTGFLCKNDIDSPNRNPFYKNPFWTRAERLVEITVPAQCTETQTAWIAQTVQTMEDAILNSPHAHDWPSLLDLDSWCAKYLIEEITANIDADQASSYFFFRFIEGETPLFLAGPLWDYDLTFGNRTRNYYPHAFLGNSEYEKASWYSPYFHALYQNPVFYQRVLSLYQDIFLPEFEALLDRGLTERAAVLSPASHMNRVRWFSPDTDISAEQIKDYLSERLGFLNEAWLEGVTFYTVQSEAKPGGDFLSYSVRDGEVCAPPEADLVLVDDPVWYDRDTGLDYDFTQPVHKDTVLLLRPVSVQRTLEATVRRILRSRKIHKLMGCCLALFIALCMLAWPDFRDWRERKRRRPKSPIPTGPAVPR